MLRLAIAFFNECLFNRLLKMYTLSSGTYINRLVEVLLNGPEL